MCPETRYLIEKYIIEIVKRFGWLLYLIFASCTTQTDEKLRHIFGKYKLVMWFHFIDSVDESPTKIGYKFAWIDLTRYTKYDGAKWMPLRNPQ